MTPVAHSSAPSCRSGARRLETAAPVRRLETAAPQPYVPLWCKSNYSFLEGASHPEELVESCHEKGIPALALTDRNGVYGIVRAQVRARRLGIHLIVGSQVDLRDGSELLLLVQDQEGYRNLCRLLTGGHLRSSKGECRLGWREVCRSSPGLIALWGIPPADPGSHAQTEPEPCPGAAPSRFSGSPLRPDRQTPPGGGSAAGGPAPGVGGPVRTAHGGRRRGALPLFWTAPPAGRPDLHPGRSDPVCGRPAHPAQRSARPEGVRTIWLVFLPMIPSRSSGPVK